jgi:Mrp family chromosome partitioning ATPase
LQTQLAEQSSTLLDGHPRIKELKAQVAEVNTLLRAEAEKLVRVFENDAKLASARVDALSANLDTLKRQAGSNNEQDVQLRALDRESKAQRDLLESYLARYREALSRESIGEAPTANARIISRGVAPNTPYFPKKTPTILIATLAAFMLSAGFVMTGEILRAGVFGAGMPLPARQRERAAVAEAPVAVEPLHPALGVSVRAIADVARRIAETADVGRRVAVFSAGDGVVTSLAALTLARVLSRESRVVLVDLAPGNPNLSAISTDPRAPGLADAVSGQCAFGDIITRDKLSRLHLVAGGATAGELIPLLASPQFLDAAEALARSYDYFVIDAGTAPETLIGRVAAIAPRAMLVAPPGADAGIETAYRHFMAVGFTDVAVATGVSSPPPTTPQPAVLDRRSAI